MGLKIDSSFLKFVTMGAVGARRVRDAMQAAGLQPIELERFSCSNKIWGTKVKRLRMPDLLCVRTGIRVEVRAKSKLSIKMSDSPNDPERRWNSGLMPNDLIAFVLVREDGDGNVAAANEVELFRVEDLQVTEALARLSDPKAYSEGTETDREWPSCVATKAGIVTEINLQNLKTLQDGRRQTYTLRGKTAYVALNANFNAESQFLAGIPPQKVAFPAPANSPWDPRPLLASERAMDRHVAVKALGVVGSERDWPELLNMARTDADHRVALEAAASAARLGSVDGLGIVRGTVREAAIPYLAMEAILILAEFDGTPLAGQCAAILTECANDIALAESELRQAAIWGLGLTGLKRYHELFQFLDAENEEERVHALAAFPSNLDIGTIRQLVEVLSDSQSSARKKAGASYILSKTHDAHQAIPLLVRLSQSANPAVVDWCVATLGQFDVAIVNELIKDQELLSKLRPLQLVSPAQNWIRQENASIRISFVSKQCL